MTKRADRMSVLIVDDQEDFLDMCREVLEDDLGHLVHTEFMPGTAARLLRERLYDLVLIDAKLRYRRTAYGGLLLAEEALTLLGANAVAVMSQFDDAEELRDIDQSFNFFRKPTGGRIDEWLKRRVLPRAQELVDAQYGFVAMPYRDDQMNAFYRTRLQPWLEAAGYQVRRMDEIPHAAAINNEIFNRIDQAHFVVLFSQGESANAFYEAGYARAKGKCLIILAPDMTGLPFNIAANYAITTNRDDEDIRADLLAQLDGLRGATAK